MLGFKRIIGVIFTIIAFVIGSIKYYINRTIKILKKTNYKAIPWTLHIVYLSVICIFFFAFSFINLRLVKAVDNYKFCYESFYDIREKENIQIEENYKIFVSIIDSLKFREEYLKGQLSNYIIREKKLEDMRQTLITNFNVTKHEARYYAYIYYDFQEWYGVPWEIFPSLINVVTYFDPTKISNNNNTKGLMQLSENIAELQANKMDIPYERNKTLLNEIHNLVLGCSYLAEGIQSQGMDFGIKRYFGGPDFEEINIKSEKQRKYILYYFNKVDKEFQRTSAIYEGIRKRDNSVYIPLFPLEFNWFYQEQKKKKSKDKERIIQI